LSPILITESRLGGIEATGSKRAFRARFHASTEQRNWTELKLHGLVFDELTNGQAVMHYSRHRLTASVTAWLWSMTNGLILLRAHWSVRQNYSEIRGAYFCQHS